MVKLKHLLVTSAVIVTSGLFAVGLYQPPGVNAQSIVKEGDAISQTEKVSGSFFGAGSTIQITDTVDGDVYAAAQNITISGKVTGDVIIAAQSVTISGTVEGSARIIAQSATITGDIGGGVSALSQIFIVDRPAKLGQDLAISAQSATIDGEVERDLLGAVDRLSIAGSVGRNVEYISDKEVRLGENSSVGGEISRTAPDNSGSEVTTDPVSAWLSGLLYTAFAITLTMLIAALVAPRWLLTATNRALPRPWKTMLAGLITLAITPLVVFLLFVSLIGIPLAIAIIFVSVALIILSVVFTSAYIGRLIFKDRQSMVIQGVVGGLIYVALLSIPLINIVAWIVGSLIGIGSIALTAFDSLSTKPAAEPTVIEKSKDQKSSSKSKPKSKPKPRAKA